MSPKDTVIFAQGPSDRKREYALSTYITRSTDGTHRTYKRALYPDAYDHVALLPQTYQKLHQDLRKATAIINIAKASHISEATVEIAYASGPTLQSAIFDAIVNQQDNAALELCDLLCEKIVGVLPTTSVNPSKNEAYVSVFGKTYNHNVTCFSNGIVDLNFDNLVLQKDGSVVLIDYEWSFDFPVPVEYIVGRSLHYLFARFASSFRAMYREGKTFVALSDNCVVPDFIYKKYKTYFDAMEAVLATEGNFQKHVSGKSHTFSLYDEPQILTHPTFQPMPAIFNALQQQQHDSQVHIRNLNAEITLKQNQIERLENRSLVLRPRTIIKRAIKRKR